MSLFTAVILRGNNLINWGNTAEYYSWALENEAALRNLNNNSYWRGFMTQKHREMNSHPNRSWSWVPNEIAEVRDAIKAKQKDYVFGPNGWSRAWSIDNCMSCNVGIKDLQQYHNTLDKNIRELQDEWIERHPDEVLAKNALNKGYAPEEEWYKLREQAVAELNTQVDSLVATKAAFNLPDWKSRYTNQSISGFCHGCWGKQQLELGWTPRMEELKRDLS